MTPDPLCLLADALPLAGFAGVERDGAVLYARADAGGGEFTASLDGADGALRLAMRFAVRASDADRAAWMRANPKGRLDIAAGETELTLALPADADLPAALDDWRALIRAAHVAAVDWRRGLRPLEGM